MADILLNVDGAQKVFKNTVHLAANTESGGKAVYTEESETTTAYLLTDPTGEMPTYEEGYSVVRSTDGTKAIICMNMVEGTIPAGFVGYADQNTSGGYLYSPQDQEISVDTLLGSLELAFEGTSSASTQSSDMQMISIKAGWFCLTASMTLCYHATREEMQAELRNAGGIPLDTFDLSQMDDYMKSVLEKAEIAVPKYAQANWNQNDPTKPDFVNGRPFGFLPPASDAITIEWDGTVGDRPAAIDGSIVMVYKGTIYPPQLYGAKLTLADKVGDADPTTQEIELTEEMVNELDAGYVIELENLGQIVPHTVTMGPIMMPAGVYLKKRENTKNDTTTVQWISKIEIPAYDPMGDSAQPVKISKAWLPDGSGGDIAIATSEKVGGVKNPSTHTESSDDVTAYVRSSDGLIKVPLNSLAQKFLRRDMQQSLSTADQASVRRTLGLYESVSFYDELRVYCGTPYSTAFVVDSNGDTTVSSLLLKSSTSGSTKSFKLTVDDTGEIPTSFYKTIADKVDELEMFKQNGGSWKFIQQLVRSGSAANMFSVGDQLACKHETYGKLVWDIIGIDHDTPADSQYTHSMTLQLHECLPGMMEFDAAETTNPNEIRKENGSNNWAESGIRQWLNSSENAGAWWKAQTDYDVQPSYAGNTDGFTKGLESEFLSAIGTVNKVTAKNTATDGGGSATTSERFFLLSMTEVYAGKNGTIEEGTAYPYYSDKSTLQNASALKDTNRVKFSNKNTRYTWRTRSAVYDYAGKTDAVSTDGSILFLDANVKCGIAPACCIV